MKTLTNLCHGATLLSKKIVKCQNDKSRRSTYLEFQSSIIAREIK